MLPNKPTKQLYAEGGMMQDGGTVDPVSGNEVPVGSLQEEVRDDISAKLSEGEFVIPADVVRYIGLEKLMKMRDAAKEGLARMEEVGQMGNADTAPAADEDFDDGFDTEIDDIIGEVDGELQMARGGFVSGEDLSKAPKNTAVDVRYYKHPDGRVMFITFINNRPMTSIPEGFTQTEGPVEQKVGKAAEERDAATGGAGAGGGGGGDGDSSFGSEGGGGGLPGSGISVTGQNMAFSAMKAAENASKIAVVSPLAALAAKGAGKLGEMYLDSQMDKMSAAGSAVAAGSPLGGVGTFAAKDGTISTISTPSMIADYDNAMFGLDTGMDVNSAGQTVSNTATIAAQNEAIFGSASSESGFSMGNAAETGMGTNAAGQSVSTDATIAAQDAAMFGSDSNNSGGGGGGGKIVCTAMNQTYGFGSFRNQIWLSYSRKHLTKEHEFGYHTLFLPLVDIGYNQGDKMHNRLIRTALEHIARHRTADLRAEMRDSKRDVLGRTYRFVLEPLCYVVGKYKLSKK
jgi:hypothetical protein